MSRSAWNEKDLETLRRMLAEGATSTEIGEAVGRNPATVRQYIRNNAHKLELLLPAIRGRGEKPVASFDKQWYGSVPYLHWSITKPWGKQCAARHVTKS
jgi:hypothetical protein